VIHDRIGVYSIREWLPKYRPDVLVVPAIIFGYRFQSYFRQQGVVNYRPKYIALPTEFRVGLIKDKTYIQPEISAYIRYILRVSSVLVGYKCTTYIESALAGVRIVEYAPPSIYNVRTENVAIEEYSDGLSNFPTREVSDIDSLVLAVRNMLVNEAEVNHSAFIRKQRQKAREHVKFLDGRSSERVSQIIDEWLEENLGPIKLPREEQVLRTRLAKATNDALKKDRMFVLYSFRRDSLRVIFAILKRQLKRIKLGIEEVLDNRQRKNYGRKNIDLNVEKDLSLP